MTLETWRPGGPPAPGCLCSGLVAERRRGGGEGRRRGGGGEPGGKQPHDKPSHLHGLDDGLEHTSCKRPLFGPQIIQVEMPASTRVQY